MATSQAPDVFSMSHRIGVARLAATLGVGAALIFVLCWIGMFIPVSSLPTPTSVYSHRPDPIRALRSWKAAFGLSCSAL